jgi:hypothetical protein
VKRFGNKKQNLAEGKEEKPRRKKTQRNLNCPNESRGRSPRRSRTHGNFSQADCTEKPMLMFGDTFPAEISRAAWTAGDGLPDTVIETPLVENSTHDSI